MTRQPMSFQSPYKIKILSTTPSCIFTNRDAKINELLAQIDNCHQQMNDMQRKDRLFYMQKELNQQKDAHHKRRNACKESTISEFNWPIYLEKPTIPTVGSHTETKRAISRRSCFKKSTMRRNVATITATNRKVMYS